MPPFWSKTGILLRLTQQWSLPVASTGLQRSLKRTECTMCSDRELWTYHPRISPTPLKRGTYVPRHVLYPQSDVEPDDEDLVRISESESSSDSVEMTNYVYDETGRIDPDFLPPIRCQLLSNDAVVPVRSSAGAAGYDLSAAHEGLVPAHGKALIKTDVAMAIPDGYYGRIAPRLSLIHI